MKTAADLGRPEGVAAKTPDVYNLPHEAGAYDHVFVCFLLEHLREPEKALSVLRRVLADGGSINVIEGDHGFQLADYIKASPIPVSAINLHCAAAVPISQF